MMCISFKVDYGAKSCELPNVVADKIVWIVFLNLWTGRMIYSYLGDWYMGREWLKMPHHVHEPHSTGLHYIPSINEG